MRRLFFPWVVPFLLVATGCQWLAGIDTISLSIDDPGDGAVADATEIPEAGHDGSVALPDGGRDDAVADGSAFDRTEVDVVSDDAVVNDSSRDGAGDSGDASLDGGGSDAARLPWEPVNQGLWGGSMTSFAADPGQSDVAYAGTKAGLYVTRDRGESWVAVDEPAIADGWVVAMDAVNLPDAGSRVYAVHGWEDFQSVQEPVLYRSDDQGRHWIGGGRMVAPIFSSLEVRADPADPNRVYGAVDRALFVSVNAGDSWSQLGQDLPGQIYDILVDPTDSRKIYLGTSAGVSASSDRGLTFAGHFNDSLGTSAEATRLAMERDGTLWAVVSGQAYRLPPQSTTWAIVPNTDWVFDVGIDPVDGKTAFLVTGDSSTSRVVRSSDHISWSNGTGIDTMALDRVEVGAAGTVWATSSTPSEGVWRSTDRGVSWAVKNVGIGAHRVWSLSAAVASDGGAPTVYAAVSGDVFVSKNAGQSWTRTPGQLNASPYDPITRVFARPDRAERVYAMGETTLLFTDNAGAIWQDGSFEDQFMPVRYAKMAFDPSNADVVYVLSQDGVIYKSVGLGPFSRVGTVPSGMEGLAVAPDDPAVVYAYAGGLLLRTSNVNQDGGAAWDPVGPPGSGCGFILVASAAEVHCGASGDWVYSSSNAGVTWTGGAGSSPGEVAGYYGALVQSGATLLLGSSPGFYERLPSGTWLDRSLGLPRPKGGEGAILTLVQIPGSPSTILAGTPARGIYRTTTAGR